MCVYSEKVVCESFERVSRDRDGEGKGTDEHAAFFVKTAGSGEAKKTERERARSRTFKDQG